MLKILCILLCLNWMKLIISGPAIEIKTGLSTPINELSINNPDKIKNDEDNGSVFLIKKAPQSEPDSISIPADDLLDMVQNEINKSEDVDKPHYIDFLTSLNEVMNGDTQKVKVLFKNVWRIVDLGVRGSSQRQRNTTKARGMLQTLKDLWAWLCRRFFSLINYFKPDGSEKEMEKLKNLNDDEKVKFLDTHSQEREEYYATEKEKSKKIDDSGVKKYSETSQH